jgi:hypothetical protein
MSAFDKITSKIAEKNAELESLKKKYMQELQGEFNEIIKLFFEECPKVQALVWTQYTPYFNDGDECIFSVNEPYFVVEGFDPENLEDPYGYEDEAYSTLKIPNRSNWDEDIENDRNYLKNRPDDNWAQDYYPKCIAALEEAKINFPGYDVKIKAFANLLNENEDMLREVYGDHSAVYLTPGEVIVEKYSHD